MEQLNRVYRACFELLDALAHYFTRQNTGIGLSARNVESKKGCGLHPVDWGIWWNVVWRTGHTSTPEGLMVSTDLLPALFRTDAAHLSKFRIEYIFQLPLIEHEWFGW